MEIARFPAADLAGPGTRWRWRPGCTPGTCGSANPTQTTCSGSPSGSCPTTESPTRTWRAPRSCTMPSRTTPRTSRPAAVGRRPWRCWPGGSARAPPHWSKRSPTPNGSPAARAVHMLAAIAREPAPQPHCAGPAARGVDEATMRRAASAAAPAAGRLIPAPSPRQQAPAPYEVAGAWLSPYELVHASPAGALRSGVTSRWWWPRVSVTKVNRMIMVDFLRPPPSWTVPS